MSALCFLGVPGGGFQAESVARKPRRHSADDRRTGPLGLSSNYTRPRPVRPSPFIQTPPRAPSPWAAESKGRLPTCHGYWPPRGAHANWRLITEQRHAWGKPRYSLTGRKTSFESSTIALEVARKRMADEQLVPGTGEDRVDSKRKCEDFAALYTLDTTHSSVAVSRGINDHT
ncbi:hypothetical protein LSAT2_013343, partial [Lamellibrachia satsuma]